MSNIKVKVIPSETIEVFAPDGSSYGKLNEAEWIDLRYQIKKRKAQGYYVYYNADKIYIQPNGYLEKTIPLFELDIEKLKYLLQ